MLSCIRSDTNGNKTSVFEKRLPPGLSFTANMKYSLRMHKQYLMIYEMGDYDSDMVCEKAEYTIIDNTECGHLKCNAGSETLRCIYEGSQPKCACAPDSIVLDYNDYSDYDRDCVSAVGGCHMPKFANETALYAEGVVSRHITSEYNDGSTAVTAVPVYLNTLDDNYDGYAQDIDRYVVLTQQDSDAWTGEKVLVHGDDESVVLPHTVITRCTPDQQPYIDLTDTPTPVDSASYYYGCYMSTAYGKTNNMIVYPHLVTPQTIYSTQKDIYSPGGTPYFVLKDTSGNILFWYADMDNDRAQDELTIYPHARDAEDDLYIHSVTYTGDDMVLRGRYVPVLV